MLNKIVVFFSLFAFVGQMTLPVSVMAQSKKKTTKKAGTKARASTSNSNTKSSSKKSSRGRSNTTRAGKTVKSPISSIATTMTSADGSCIAQFVDCMDAQINPIIEKYSYLAEDPAIQAMQETGDPLRCVYYNRNRVEGLFDSEKYCSEDVLSGRTDVLMGTDGQAKASKTVKSKDAKGNETTRSVFNNLNICSNQKDINDLYLSYNYYCDLNTSDIGVTGMPVNKCDLKQSDGKNRNAVFATKDSYAYYNEANRRVEAGELKIINFEETNLYKNKIAKLGLENWEMMSLTSKTCTNSNGDKCIEGEKGCSCVDNNSVDDLLADLGLGGTEGADGKKELFSINVVPPVGAGSLNPGSQYEKARNICFGTATFKQAGSKITADETTVKNAISYITANCSNPYIKSEMERYYIAGTQVNSCDDGYYYNPSTDKCISLTDAEDIVDAHTSEDLENGSAELRETDFLSTKKSCDLLEQTLISTRNKAYADFDTRLKNYIEDEVAKLVKNKSKSLTTMANALNNLKTTDAQITIDAIQRDADIITAKSDAEIAKLTAETNLMSKRLEVDKKTLEVRRERAKMFSEEHVRKINAHCIPKAFLSILTSCKDPEGEGRAANLNRCVNINRFLSDPDFLYDIMVAMNEESFYIDIDGNIQDAYSSYEVVMDENGSVTDIKKDKDGKTVKTRVPKPDGYEEIYCVDMPNFKTEVIIPAQEYASELYNKVLIANCTGDVTGLMDFAEKAVHKFGQMGLDGHNWGTMAGKNVGNAITQVISGIGNVIGGIVNGIKDVIYNKHVYYTAAYMTSEQNGGKCVYDKKTEKSFIFGIGKSTSTSTHDAQGLDGQFIGRGTELFKNLLDIILPEAKDENSDKK